jgi:hypothetical protein
MNEMKSTNWTIRTRHLTSGDYHQASFCAMALEESKRLALADRPNCEVVGVWPHVFELAN